MQAAPQKERLFGAVGPGRQGVLRIPLVMAAMLVLGLSSLFTVTAAATTSPSGPTLASGTALEARSSLHSRDGRYELAMQRDGNLVEYEQGKPIWSTNSAGRPGAYLQMQRNGDLVLYWGQRPLWSSGTDLAGDEGASLVLQDDGNLVIYTAVTHLSLWTSYRPPPSLELGDTGAAVAALQRRLTELHYWVGPANGIFGDSTQQAVWALDKAAGIERSGIVGPAARSALARGVEPLPRPAAGNPVEVDLADDLVMILRNGKLWATLNTSTGGGYTYTSQGVTSVATTPTGIFHVYSEIDGSDTAPLGVLWRPKFFTGGYAIHGDGDVPPYPASHGCVRVSDEAMNWIWAKNLIPIGTEVWLYT